MTTINTKGFKELDQFLKQLPEKLQINVMRGAIRAAGRVYRDEARSNVNSISGNLAKSIRVSAKLDRANKTIRGTVKAGKVTKQTLARRQKGQQQRVPGVFYAHFVEFGTRPHLIKVPEDEKRINYRRSRKLGIVVRESLTTINRRSLKIGSNFTGPTVMHPGARPKPFMRPAFDTQSRAAIKAAGEYIKKRLRTKHGLNTKDVNIEVDEE